MSILVDGIYTSRVLTSSISPVTVLFAAFRSRLPLGRSHNFALTINGGLHGSFTTVLPCFVSPHLAVDICLRLDWDGQYTGVAHRPWTAPDRSTKPFACCRGIYVPHSNDGPSCYFNDLGTRNRRCFPRGQCILIELCHVTLWDRHRILP
ncbi:hypothetical protein C8J57DRAFT_1393347 [Mycena rebaudengoi]|nr:hypothetical protein C8J57DRAFT_1393347 [Mycena rebaudengoi]